jgi:hypothetical protein
MLLAASLDALKHKNKRLQGQAYIVPPRRMPFHAGIIYQTLPDTGLSMRFTANNAACS